MILSILVVVYNICSIDYDSEEDIEFTQTEDIEVLSSFDTMGLKEDLLRGIYAYGMYFFLQCHYPISTSKSLHSYNNLNIPMFLLVYS